MVDPKADSGAVTVVIVDDHDMVALGLQALLDDAPGVEVIGRAGSVSGALELVAKRRPEVVLMDYRLPDGTGVEAASALRANDDPPAIVMVSSANDRRVLGQALDAGCCGFVSKNADQSDLVAAVEAAASGDTYFTRDVLKHLVHLRRFDQVEAGELTDREVEVLQAIADGLSPDEIATKLFLSAHTVKNHLRHAMAKLEAHTKLDAVVMAIKSRIISIDD